MIESAIVLLAKQGYRATSFDAVIERANAPRGSIYHHFPGGKDELIAAAIDLAGERAIAVVDGMKARVAAGRGRRFHGHVAPGAGQVGFEAGCSVLAVTVSAETPQLRAHAGRDLRPVGANIWPQHSRRGESITAAADTFAATVIAASEGAVALEQSRATALSRSTTSPRC